MNWLRSHLTFDRGQRDGIFRLLALVLSLIALNVFVEFEAKTKLDMSAPMVEKLQAEMDSLKRVQKEKNTREIYPFNPNYLTEYKAYTLGLSVSEFDKLKAYREQGKWINSVSEFKKVTGVSDSLLKEISVYFNFPEWVTNRKKSGKNYVNNFDRELDFSEKKDLNTATATQLEEIYGVGKTLSKRIVAYRNKIGGFASEEHLYAVYGLKEEVIERIMNRFAVKTQIDIDKMKINEVSASEIATIPGISFEKAKKIWEFVRVREGLENLSELEKIEGISARELRLIRLYLSTE
ncbi:competence protein ComEA [Pukyongia salina]|uniref:Competence protein ComEA n=1 Tax=Pukyongia salina TaxID=2094025 RepID=A0A2S0HT90_9FLAO|nr:helix-hairpin-helix domain-containing protein [Pukyongia salina]AVI49909.1 competence protein ComEA [Pukyongia salina]